TGGVGCEERNHVGDVGGLPDSSQRGGRYDRSLDLRAVVHPCARVGVDDAGRHCVHGDAPWSQCLGQGAAQDVDRALAHRVVGERGGDPGGGGGDVDDASAVAQQRQGPLDDEERCPHVDRVAAVERLGGDLLERGEVQDARVVDEDVQR